MQPATRVARTRPASSTPLVAKASRAMLDAGLRDVRNQGVLLDGVNADPHTLLDLCFALLDGARGRTRADVPALVELLLDLSDFVAAHAGQIDEIDLNPVWVGPLGQGVQVLDALIAGRRAAGASA